MPCHLRTEGPPSISFVPGPVGTIDQMDHWTILVLKKGHSVAWMSDVDLIPHQGWEVRKASQE